MSFVKDNEKYERWLRKHCRVVEVDLGKKHERMRESAFVFLRATFFRWAKRVEGICADLAKTPPVLSVGDLHLENFGTWRDAEGRLVWGVNDFDEAAVIPYAFDLVRLATSARLAANLPIGNRAIARALIDGYSDGFERPRPTLLDEQERWMRPYVAVTDHGRDKFWHEIDHLPDATPPDAVKKAVESAGFPEGAGDIRYATHSHFLDLANGRHRSPDPFLRVHEGSGVQERFIVRRMAADARKINLRDDADAVNSARMVTAMGFDLGAIHAADERGRHAIRRDLDKARRGDDWLYEAARDVADAVNADYDEWHRDGRIKP